MTPLSIRPAHRGELTTVMNILDEAARWLLARGIRQWESPPPAECWNEFGQHIEARRVYLVWTEESADPIGTFRLEWQGGTLWEDARKAGYLYTVALRPNWIGRGIGGSIIEWAGRQVAAQGGSFLRLDCIAANGQLRRWYERLGFVYRGVGEVGSYVLARYELEL